MNARPVSCSKCWQPITAEQVSRSVCFKVPGTERYEFFHCRTRSEDCWEAYLKEGKSA